MKLLLDMNVPRQVGRLLEPAGHTFRHVGDLGFHDVHDSEILEIARLHGEVVLTHDLDFGGRLAFSGESRPSVPILRRRNLRPRDLYESLEKSDPS